jgi:hypothetical protein
MYEIAKVARTIWLRTDRVVVLTKTTDWHHLPAIENALHQGLFAIRDMKRPEFYEIEVGDNWYYIHIPSCIPGVYLIATGRRSSAKSETSVAVERRTLSGRFEMHVLCSRECPQRNL